MTRKTSRAILKQTQMIRRQIVENNNRIRYIISQNEFLATEIVQLSIKMSNAYLSEQRTKKGKRSL